MTSNPPQGIDNIDLRWLALVAGSDQGGRARFGLLVHDLVLLRNRSARMFDDRGGDWGIDTFAGSLDGGRVAVWQAKYFLQGVGSSQRQQIADSLATVEAKGASEGFQLGAWTLCLPCELTPPEDKWWRKFKRDNEKRLKIRFDLWVESHIRAFLLAPEAAAIRSYYFGPPGPPSPLATEELPDPLQYDEALFVAQLRAAGISETMSAKQQFFNAELLTREVGDKGLEEEIAELRTRRAEVHAIWEARFNEHDATDRGDRLPGLNPEVMRALEDHHRSCSPSHLRAGLIHTLGLIHQHVQDKRAGWTRNWRAVASKFDG